MFRNTESPQNFSTPTPVKRSQNWFTTDPYQSNSRTGWSPTDPNGGNASARQCDKVLSRPSRHLGELKVLFRCTKAEIQGEERVNFRRSHTMGTVHVHCLWNHCSQRSLRRRRPFWISVYFRWILVRFRWVSGKVSVRFRLGLDSVPFRFRWGSVPVRFRFVSGKV